MVHVLSEVNVAEDHVACLGRFRRHSFESWYWHNGRYRRECTLFGCRFSETVEDVRPRGRIQIVGGEPLHEHDWSRWLSTADQFGLYLPPWGYKRTCSGCGAVQQAENVEAGAA